MLNEHVFFKSVLCIFNKYFFMVTIYIEGVYVVVKNQKSSLPSGIITCANVKKGKELCAVNREL